MATYIHSKMAANDNKGHRRWGDIPGRFMHQGFVGPDKRQSGLDREVADGDRPRRSSRNGGKYFIRFVDGLRSRFRAAAGIAIEVHTQPGPKPHGTFPRQRKYPTCERLIKMNMPFGGPKGTTTGGKSIKRSNISVGDKSKIRIT